MVCLAGQRPAPQHHCSPSGRRFSSPAAARRKKRSRNRGAHAGPVETAVRGAIDHMVTADAVLYPINQANVTSKISAPVRRVLVNRGDHVRAGQLLVELESGDLAASASESKSQYEQAQAAYQIAHRRHRSGRPDQGPGRRRSRAARRSKPPKRFTKAASTLVKRGRPGAKAGGRRQGRHGAGAKPVRYRPAASPRRSTRSASGQAIRSAPRPRWTPAKRITKTPRCRLPTPGAQPHRRRRRRPAGISRGNARRRHAAGFDRRYLAGGGARQYSGEGSRRHPAWAVPPRIAGPDGDIAGKVTVVSPAVDPSTTTVEVWVQAPNPGEKLKPGGTVRVSIIAETIQNTMVVPAAGAAQLRRRRRRSHGGRQRFGGARAQSLGGRPPGRSRPDPQRVAGRRTGGHFRRPRPRRQGQGEHLRSPRPKKTKTRTTTDDANGHEARRRLDGARQEMTSEPSLPRPRRRSIGPRAFAAHHLRHPHAGRAWACTWRSPFRSPCFPSTDFPRIVVGVDNGVAPINQMQVTVTRPIEEAMNSVPGLEEVRSTTSRGSAEINLFFNWNVNMFQTLQYVNAALARVQPDSASHRQAHRQPPDFRRVPHPRLQPHFRHDAADRRSGNWPTTPSSRA